MQHLGFRVLANPLAALLLAGCLSATPPGGDDFASPADLSSAPDDGGGNECSPKCSGLAPFCNASKHCVSCLADADCAPGTFCRIVSDAIATCTPGCMTDDRCANGQKCCGNQCADTATDVKNCGGCGMPCMAQHSAAACVAGMCTSGKCDVGWGDCNNNTADGCESNLHADVNNCTGCGMKCAIPNANVGCADGCYATACKFGFDDCNLNTMDGCETSVLVDKNNCGGCGKPCVNLPNATSICTNGSCLLDKCNQGYANCDGMAANGCEVNTNTNVSNCGACGNVCPMGNICVGGGCTCPMCNIPNASAKCVNNQCVFDKCNPGFADCDNNTGNGCEVNINSDKNNCSKCGMVCPLNLPNCSNGACNAMPICMRIGWKFGQDNWACPNGFRMPTINDLAAVMPCFIQQDLNMFNDMHDIATVVGGCNCKWNGNWCGQPSIETIRKGRMCGDFNQLHICIQ